MTDVFVLSAVAVLIFTTAGWLLSLRLKDVSIVDPMWGPGFVLVAWIAHTTGDAPSSRGLLVAGLVTIWGLRLGLHLTIRKFKEPEEDSRYKAMRDKREGFALKSLWIVFWLQGALMLVVSLPVMLAMADDSTKRLYPLAIAGIALWATGLFFESVGDAQLKRFKADPANKGKVMDRGLWRYTRHPNYFGDACMWWGIFLVCMEVTSAWPGVIGPIVMTFLLMKVSGVAMLEKTIGSRRPGYAEYMRKTNAFFPGPAKKP